MAEENPTGFTGDLDDQRLTDIIQICCLSRLSRTVKVEVEGQSGEIHILEGQVCHAETGKLSGEEAFYEMLRKEEGRFEAVLFSETPKTTISKGWEYLLIEALRVRQSASRDESSDKAGTGGSFSGKLFGFQLQDLVQLACISTVDRTLTIRLGESEGRIVVRGGKVVHAEIGGLAGDRAFNEIMLADSGTFSSESPGDSPESITTPWDFLLIDAMRYRDEKKGKSEDEKESLPQRLGKLKVSQKIKAAMTGDKETRMLLIRDSNRLVQFAVINNPRITDGEAATIALSRNVDEEVLRKISGNRDWVKMYNVRYALATNPKTPMAVSTRLVQTLNANDLKLISKSKSVPTAVAMAARRELQGKV